MNGTRPRTCLLGLVAAAVLAAPPAPADAQTLPLKRAVPVADAAACVPEALQQPGATPSPEEASEAQRLATSATQANLLGDHATARELLGRAARLDPTAEHVAYLLARTFEELGDHPAAVQEYCRYLALDPDDAGASEAEAAMGRLADHLPRAVPEAAATAFREGIRHFDEGRPAEAEAAFARAVGEAPLWAAAYYNRGAARAARGQADAAVRDLRTYLDLEPAAADRELVGMVAGLLAQTPARGGPGPGAAFLSGLFPGGGHFATGRPLVGAGVLAVAAGAAAYGVFTRERVIDCLTMPVDDACPPGERLSEEVERPRLAAGLGAAAVVTVLGALDAARGAQGAAATVRLGGPGAGGASLVVLPTEAQRVRGGGVGISWLGVRF